jgi:predicted Fe-S protein YdhL (DUF1289 family)
MADGDQEVESPCIRMCTLDDRNVCIGCWRSLDEIVSWGQLTSTERTRVLEQARRRSALKPDLWS